MRNGLQIASRHTEVKLFEPLRLEVSWWHTLLKLWWANANLNNDFICGTNSLNRKRNTWSD